MKISSLLMKSKFVKQICIRSQREREFELNQHSYFCIISICSIFESFNASWISFQKLLHKIYPKSKSWLRISYPFSLVVLHVMQSHQHFHQVIGCRKGLHFLFQHEQSIHLGFQLLLLGIVSLLLHQGLPCH